MRILKGLAVVAAMAVMVAPAAAEASHGDTPEVRVVNNHGYRVRVVLVDETGAHHSLGRVGSRKAAAFTLDEHDVVGRDVRVKVVVDEPAWSAGNTGDAIRSTDLRLDEGSAVYVWIEPDLEETDIEVVH